jgi:hypothetical protein
VKDSVKEMIKLREKLRKLEIIEELEKIRERKLNEVKKVEKVVEVEKAGKVGQYVIYGDDVDLGKIIQIRSDGIYEVLMASDAQVRLFNEIAFSNGKTLKIVDFNK